jgi:NTP pyrophosphatase (non-canonical NTP hydrolase)
MKDMQKDVDDWVNQFKYPYWPPLSILARITEEVGELASELNDRYGGRVKKPTDDVKDIGDELSDIIFAIICLANSHNINLDESWRRIMDKCYQRDNDRFERKEAKT